MQRSTLHRTSFFAERRDDYYYYTDFNLSLLDYPGPFCDEKRSTFLSGWVPGWVPIQVPFFYPLGIDFMYAGGLH
jgi:hypothetical protein